MRSRPTIAPPPAKLAHRNVERIELQAGAWLQLWHQWLSDDAASELGAALVRDVAWEQRHIVLFGKRILQPRLIGWAGELPYRYSGQTLEPRPWPEVARPVLASVEQAAGAAFNHVLINRYRDGNDSMGYHADAEPELGPDPAVATLSLGGRRRFLLRRHGKHAGAPLALWLEPGSLLVMGGTCQRHYRHAIPRDAAPEVRERISLTFRQVLASPGQLPRPQK
jgi:alkylated DNA repair dioxygenase AlkB